MKTYNSEPERSTKMHPTNKEPIAHVLHRSALERNESHTAVGKLCGLQNILATILSICIPKHSQTEIIYTYKHR